MPECNICGESVEDGLRVVVDPVGDVEDRYDSYETFDCVPCYRMVCKIAEYEEDDLIEIVDEDGDRAGAAD